MPVKNKPYEQFGSYLLFRKLESDTISELWRAARFDDRGLGAAAALRRFTGGDRAALTAAANRAGTIAPQLTGTSFVREQVAGVIDGVPFLAHEYSGGRSLRHIVDRGRGATGGTPNPLPLDQAIAVAEKIALSLATTAELRVDGERLLHGGLLPQLVWISDDGETRVSGQLLGPGLTASLADPRVAAELGRYFAPELQPGGTASKATEVFSLGAIFFLLVTGIEPPEPSNASAFGQAVVAARTLAGSPVPQDVRAVLARSLTIDPSTRYASVADMKQAISTLASGGQYSATTFNLAFYVSTLLKKELEGEALDREREAKVNLAPYLAPEPQPVAVPIQAPPPPVFAAAAEPQKRSKAPLVAAAVVALGLVGAGAWMMLTRKAAGPVAATSATAQMVPKAPQKLVLQPLVASTSTAPATATDTAGEEAARKQAFEQAVEAKLQEEVMKLQQEYTKKLQKEQSKQAPVAAAPQRAADEGASSPSAAQLDQQKLAAAKQETPATSSPAAPEAAAPAASATPVPAVAEAPPPVREGDVVEVATLDTVPKAVHIVTPIYPVMAIRQRAEATIIVTALVSENGDVIEAKILRGDKRFGFEDAAMRAVRATRFSPAVKDGKRVKTWFPVPVSFKL